MSPSAADAWPTPFAAALLDPAAAVPAGLRAPHGADPTARFNVYRNNVVVSLTAALGDAFPALRALLGTDGFAGLARAFLAAHPPRSPVLTDWGDALPDCLATAGAAAPPWAAELARLERAWLVAWHAAEAVPLAAPELAARLADPAALPAARLTLHPSVAALASPVAIVSLWRAGQAGVCADGLAWARPEAALVVRPADAALVVRVPAGTAALVAALAAGAPLGVAAAQATAQYPDLDLPLSLAVLIRHGGITGWG